MVLRILGKCRKCRLSEWDSARAGFWDAAVAGSSALRAAIWRSFLDESAGLLGATVASALIDIARFYDSLDPCKLIGKLRELDFPRLQLALHAQIHWAGRLIMNDECSSELVHVTRSILAGDMSSNSMARGYIYEVCERVHCEVPRAGIGSFVDDLHIRVEGARSAVAAQLADAVEVCCEGIKRDLLVPEVSKSIIVASNIAYARKVVGLLAARHLKLKPSRGAKDLGIDSAGGVTRRVTVMRGRFAKGELKTARLRVFKSFLKGAAKRRVSRLWSASVSPGIMYGSTSQGLGHTRLQQARRMAMLGTGVNPSRQCVTSTLAITLGGRNDPAVKLRCDTVFQWIGMLFDPRMCAKRVAGAWASMRLKLGGVGEKGRWGAVTGPLGACMATLLDLEWDPVGPGEWVSPPTPSFPLGRTRVFFRPQRGRHQTILRLGP